MDKSRKVYEVTFKKNIVKLYDSGVKVSELKTKYSVSETNIYKWINQYSTKPNTEMKDVNDEAYSADDIMKMKSQIKSLQEDNEILKKAMTIFATK